jgi:hypothetical protein
MTSATDPTAAPADLTTAPADPTTPAVPAGPLSFTALVGKATDDKAAMTGDSLAIANATAKLAADTSAENDDLNMVVDHLKTHGPKFVGPNADGSVDVYFADNSAAGFTSINAKPGTEAPAPGP